MTDVLACLAPAGICSRNPLDPEAPFRKDSRSLQGFGRQQQQQQQRFTAKFSTPRRIIGARLESQLRFGAQLQLPFSSVASALPKRNLCLGVCRGVSGRAVAASSASNGKDGRKSAGSSSASGKPKSGKKDSSTKKGDSNGQNVWTSTSPSNKKKSSSSSSSSSKISKESGDGGRRAGGSGDSSFTSTSGRIGRYAKPEKEAEKPLQALKVSSTAAAPKRGGKSKEQQTQDPDDTIFLQYLSPMPLIEEEVILQREEPIVSPSWTTFCGNTSGVWRGVGAAFSPETAEFEPISLNENNEFIYDARVLSTVETLRTSEDGVILSPEQQSLHRRVLWSLEDHRSSSTSDSRVMETQYVQDDDGVRVSSFIADTGENVDDDEEELEMEYWDDDESLENVEGGPSSEWENSEDCKENGDQAHWEYVLAGPKEYSERWQQNGHLVEQEQDDALGVLQDDAGSISEDGKEWRSMWDRGEVLDGNWAPEGDSPCGEGSTTNPIHELAALTSTAQFSRPAISLESSSEADVSQGTVWTDVMEEDLMVLDDGLVFFQDGSYSRGPLELAPELSTSDDDSVNGFTFKVEQCLMAGGHRRLRVVHTVCVEDEKVEVLRLAVYEEEWMGPCHMKSISDVGGHQLKLFSERPRLDPEDILGTWKVFEMEGMFLHAEETSAAQEQGSYLFSCKETAIKRKFPEMPKLKYNDDDSVDLREFSTSWLPGKLSVYVNFTDSGFLTFGVGWICEDKTRLVMERNYRPDGKLTHVSSKSEMKSSGLGRR